MPTCAVGQAIAILGRDRRAADQPAARILDEIVEEELRRLFHHRIGAREKRAIRVEQVVLPQMLREPRGAGRPQSGARQIAGRGEAPDVGDVMRDEAARAVVHARGLAAWLAQRIEKVEQRLVQLGEVGHLRRPVVHLQVDVEVIVGVPRRAHAVVPQALQVGGQIARPAAGDQQVAAELEVQRVERRIGRAALHALEPFVGRQRRDLAWLAGAEPQRHAAVQPLMIGDDASRAVARRLAPRRASDRARPARRGSLPLKLGAGGHDDRRGVGALDTRMRSGNVSCDAAFGDDLRRREERQALAARELADQIRVDRCRRSRCARPAADRSTRRT